MKLKSFILQFAIPEIKSISGKWYKNLFVLTAICLFAIFSIGLGSSTVLFLKTKMDNPFIKFISVTVPFNNEPDLKSLNKVEVKKHFDYDEVTPIIHYYVGFKSKNEKQCDALVRKINSKEKLYKFLINNDNKFLLTENKFKDNSWGVIVTESFLAKKYGSDSNVSYINFKPIGKNYTIPIPVKAIVTDLPNEIELLASEKLYPLLIRSGNQYDITSEEHKNYLKIFIEDENAIPLNLNEIGFDKEENESIIDGITLIVYNIENPDSLFSVIKKDYPNAIRLYDLDRIPPSQNFNQAIDNISFSFNELDSISSFKEYLSENHKLKIDMNTIETKNNFSFFEKLAILLSISLIAFCIITIFVFTTNIILSHIEKNKKNIGTLKAFGLSNVFIIYLYTAISGLMISIAFIVSYNLSYYFGNACLHSIYKLFKLTFDENILIFQNYPLIYLLICFIFIPLIVILIRIWWYIRNKTPGDLIYERD